MPVCIGQQIAQHDTTEQHLLFLQLSASMKEITELKKAVDAHAIVAVTDVRTVIVGVNEKFCEVSGYSESELIGQSLRLVRSDHHPEGFYSDMWRTITQGRIWNGECCNRARDGSLYWIDAAIVPTLDDAGKPIRYIAICTDITQRKRAELQVQQMAYQDVLTGLPNRRLLIDRLGQQMAASARSQRFCALMFLDLDHFKEVNDSLGHESGDALLHEAAVRMQQCVRGSDTVARFGGDEFVVLLPDVGNSLVDATSHAGKLGEGILCALSTAYRLQDTDVVCTPSIGITIFNGQALGITELLKQADIALYQAKQAGRNTVCFFDPAIQRSFERRMGLEADLRKAMVNREFEVFYQPITNHQRKRIGVEALLRWRHPHNGLVSPADFIPLAETTGLIVPLGLWVIEQACQTLAQWQTDPVRRSWSIAVNVSERQFRHPDFVADVIGAIEAERIRPGLLKLEVTEGSLQTDLHGTVDKMNQLRAWGVRFSIDDFGTGYSSLSYLKELPIHTLKIDRAFVKNIDSSEGDAVIARTILALAEQLGLEVVVEGVETDAQFQILCDLGCNQFQGYLLGRPVPVDQLVED